MDAHQTPSVVKNVNFLLANYMYDFWRGLEKSLMYYVPRGIAMYNYRFYRRYSILDPPAISSCFWRGYPPKAIFGLI